MSKRSSVTAAKAKDGATQTAPRFTQRGWLPPRRGGYVFDRPDGSSSNPRPPRGGAGVALADSHKDDK